eukprot:3453194-Rhodomonas_salina.2
MPGQPMSVPGIAYRRHRTRPDIAMRGTTTLSDIFSGNGSCLTVGKPTSEIDIAVEDRENATVDQPRGNDLWRVLGSKIKRLLEDCRYVCPSQRGVVEDGKDQGERVEDRGAREGGGLRIWVGLETSRVR